MRLLKKEKNKLLRNTVSISLLIALVGYCMGQSGIKGKYRDLLEPNSKLISSGINFTLERLDSDRFLLKRYYPENRQITHRISLRSINPIEKHGPYEERYDDGTLLHQGAYIDDMKEGAWIENVREKGQYNNGIRTGKWIRV